MKGDEGEKGDTGEPGQRGLPGKQVRTQTHTQCSGLICNGICAFNFRGKLFKVL